MKNPRQIVAEALLKVDSRGAWSNLTLDSQFRKYGLDSRDSAFAGALFYGVLERLVTLDACIAAHSKIRLDKLDPVVRTALRISLYQLLYMNAVPDHAAVGEGVELVKKLGKGQASGFVNGVLRSFLRAGKAVPLPKAPLEAALSVEYSCPAPLVKRWLESYGLEDTRRILEASLGRPPLYVRVNTLETTPEKLMGYLEKRGVSATPDRDLADCLVLEQPGAVQQLPQYRQGLFHVQDKASQLCALALEAEPGMRVLDACAAPGGKAFTLAQIMGNTGEILACDLHEHRTKLIAQRAKKMGLKNIEVRTADMSRPHEDLGEFDRVLCDVPCSGLGVMRRRPEIKYKALEEFEKLPNLQYKILQTTAQYCKVGGRVIYSTCTLLPGENEEVADRFLAEHPEYEPAALPEILGGLHPRGRTLLDELGADGFFLAAFTRKA